MAADRGQVIRWEWSAVPQGVCSSAASLSKPALSPQQHWPRACPIRAARTGGVHVNRSGHVSTLLMTGLALGIPGCKGCSCDPTGNGGEAWGAGSLSYSWRWLLPRSSLAPWKVQPPLPPVHCESSEADPSPLASSYLGPGKPCST